MRKTHTSKIIVLGALCCALSAACSSGGGGGMSQSATTSGGTAPAAPVNTAPAPDSTDTGIAGTVAAPAAATFATGPAQLATPGGPSLDGTSGSYPTNVTFPLLLGGLQKTSTGLSPTPGDPAATATVLSDSSNSSAVQVVIPSLGINQTITMHSDAAGGGDDGQPIYGLSYVAVGFWGVNSSPNVLSNGVYVFGFETPQAAMPTSGTAVFSGMGTATATIYKTVGTEIQSGFVGGNASITANFGSGAINGSFTQMKVFSNAVEQWNDVSVTANIATGSNTFSGSTVAASAPGAPMSLSGSAVGKINGAFFGPAAQNLGAVWSLSDGTGSALGTVLAGH
jgi:hypothetical protein